MCGDGPDVELFYTDFDIAVKDGNVSNKQKEKNSSSGTGLSVERQQDYATWMQKDRIKKSTVVASTVEVSTSMYFLFLQVCICLNDKNFILISTVSSRST